MGPARPLGALKMFVAWPIIKGVAMATVTLAVVHSQLQPFAQALIIAIVSGVLGALGMIAAAIVSSKQSARAARAAERTEMHVADLKAKVEADRRVGDNPES